MNNNFISFDSTSKQLEALSLSPWTKEIPVHKILKKLLVCPNIWSWKGPKAFFFIILKQFPEVLGPKESKYTHTKKEIV